MKVSVLQENLLKALTRTGRIIASKTQLPIVQNVLLFTEENFLRITATNLETSVSVLVGGKIIKSGGICVPSKLLTELIVSLPQETISLEVKEGALEVSTPRTKATLPGISKEEFPSIKMEAAGNTQSLPKEVLAGTLGTVLFAAATDEGRPLLTGVKIRKEGDILLFAATDGYRLSVKKTHFVVEGSMDMVVPARALAEVNKLLMEEKEEKSVKIGKTDDGQLVFNVGETTITTRLIDGEYPGFEKIIPKTHTTSAKGDREVFLRAVKSASIFARDNANIVRIHLEKNECTVSANTPQVGQNTVDVEADVEGEGGDIAFNSRFLIDILSNIPDGEVVFEMTGSLNSGAFHLAGDDSFVHIIMPVRVNT
jgi:DNA polymerase III subunit beta